MKILLDGMGGDNAPKAVVEGAVMAAREFEHEIILIGDEERLEKALKEASGHKRPANISICHASEVITNNEAPALAIRRKKDSSIVVGMNMLKRGEGDLFISAGSTGALLAGGLLIIGRIKGIDRPAICTIYPILGKEASLLCDAGANAECKANNLVDFAIMSSIYMEKVLGRENPTVALVNIGEEEEKGSPLTKETFELLKNTDLNFKGNIEARDVPKGRADIIVTDGFTGNIILKLTEGMAWNVFKTIKKKFTDGMHARLGSLLLVDKLKELKKEFDYSEYGGAPILGIKRPVVKMHGSSSAKGVKSTILKAVVFAEQNVIEIIEESI
ncbi:MAG: phosphate acyltransferase PlsX [Firmicutes bacterium]|nr:phosphate acyltransferase PlsX [Bacillota bacterium]